MPTSLKLIRGNPGKRAINKREPQPSAKAPRCPDFLDEIAKREWSRMLPILKRMKVLTEADGVALANLCQALSTMIQAQEALSKSGLLVKAQSGWVQQSPLVSVVQSQMKIVNQLCGEFGLTPSSRSRITTASEPDKSNPYAGM